MLTLQLRTCIAHRPQPQRRVACQVRSPSLGEVRMTHRPGGTGVGGTRVLVTPFTNEESEALHVSLHCDTSCHRLPQGARACASKACEGGRIGVRWAGVGGRIWPPRAKAHHASSGVGCEHMRSARPLPRRISAIHGSPRLPWRSADVRGWGGARGPCADIAAALGCGQPM